MAVAGVQGEVSQPVLMRKRTSQVSEDKKNQEKNRLRMIQEHVTALIDV